MNLKCLLGFHDWHNEYSFIYHKSKHGVLIIITSICLSCNKHRKLKLLRTLGSDGWFEYEQMPINT